MTTARSSRGLDRVRPRSPEPQHVVSVTESRDADGKRALFSVATPEASGFGSLTVECSHCGVSSVLSGFRALRATIPSVHLPFIRRDHPSYLKCPDCGQFAWVRLSVHF